MQYRLPPIDDEAGGELGDVRDEEAAAGARLVDEDDEDDDALAGSFFMTCGLLPASMCGTCAGDDDGGASGAPVDLDAPEAPARSNSTFSRSRGRIARALVVGSSTRKAAVVEALRLGVAAGHGSGPRRAASVSTDVVRPADGFGTDGTTRDARARTASDPRPVVIVNTVPARDLNQPRATSEFYAYLDKATCAIVAVDYDLNPRWDCDAAEWIALLKDTKDVPVALLISTDDRVENEDPRVQEEVDHAFLVEDADAFCTGAEVIGWWRNHPNDPDRDETRRCMEAVLDSASQARH